MLLFGGALERKKFVTWSKKPERVTEKENFSKFEVKVKNEITPKISQSDFINAFQGKVYNFKKKEPLWHLLINACSLFGIECNSMTECN